MKFKKYSVYDTACLYALCGDISSEEHNGLSQWLETHCPDQYELSGTMHLILDKKHELFFELTFEITT